MNPQIIFLTSLVCLLYFSNSVLSLRRQQIGQYYFISWEFGPRNLTITIELEVETIGFIGFGIARTPFVALMNQSDIVIGGVNDDDGVEYLKDFHGIGTTFPVEDKQQDYNPLGSYQNTTHTIVKFSRFVVTGDSDDVDIILGSQTIIWSFGESDRLEYHGGINRGSFYLNWLG